MQCKCACLFDHLAQHDSTNNISLLLQMNKNNVAIVEHQFMMTRQLNWEYKAQGRVWQASVFKSESIRNDSNPKAFETILSYS
jgi:hypothetical protein